MHRGFATSSAVSGGQKSTRPLSAVFAPSPPSASGQRLRSANRCGETVGPCTADRSTPSRKMTSPSAMKHSRARSRRRPRPIARRRGLGGGSAGTDMEVGLGPGDERDESNDGRRMSCDVSTARPGRCIASERRASVRRSDRGAVSVERAVGAASVTGRRPKTRLRGPRSSSGQTRTERRSGGPCSPAPGASWTRPELSEAVCALVSSLRLAREVRHTPHALIAFRTR